MCDRQPFREYANGALIVELYESHHLVTVFIRLASDDMTNTRSTPSHADRQHHLYNHFFLRRDTFPVKSFELNYR